MNDRSNFTASSSAAGSFHGGPAGMSDGVRKILTPKVLGYLLLIACSVLFAFVGIYADPRFPIIAILGIVGLLVLVRRPFVGFLIYVAFVYLRPADLFPILATIKFQFLMLAFLIVLWLLHSFVFSKRGYVTHRIDGWMTGYVLIMFLSIFTSVYIGVSVGYFSEFIRFYILWLLMSQVIDDETRLRQTTWVILGSLLFVALIQIWTYGTLGLNRSTGLGGYGIHVGPIHIESMRPATSGAEENVHGVGGYSAGFLGNASELGLAILAMFPFAFYLFPFARTKAGKWTLGSMIGVYLVSLVVCGARGAFVGLVVVFGILFWQSQKKVAIALVTLIALAIVVPLLPDQYLKRIGSTANYEEDESANIRLTLWGAGLRMMADRPFLGVGVGNFPTAYGNTYRPPGSANLWWEPHNIFIQSGSEMGLLGMGFFIALMATTFVHNRKNRRRLEKLGEKKTWLYNYLYAVDLGVVGYVVSGCFITSTYYPHLYLFALFARTADLIVDKKVADSLSTEPPQLSDPVSQIPALPAYGGSSV